MMTTLATLLFTAMMATALLSLAWDLTRQLADPDTDDVFAAVRAEAARIAALPRIRQPLRLVDGSLIRPAPRQPAAIKRPAMPALAVAA